MREIKSGNTTLRIRATNLARTYFYQEFGADLDEELAPIQKARMDAAKNVLAQMSKDEIETIVSVNGIQNLSAENAAKFIEEKGILKNQKLSQKLYALTLNDPKIPPMSALRLVWAMNAAQNFAEGEQTPPFDAWIAKYDEFNVNDCMADIIAECDKGFFR